MMLKVIYRFMGLKENDVKELDKFCIESNNEITKMSQKWIYKKWERFIQSILFARDGNNLVIAIPNPINLPLNVMKQFIQKLRMEKNMEKWLNEHDIKDYKKEYEVI